MYQAVLNAYMLHILSMKVKDWLAHLSIDKGNWKVYNQIAMLLNKVCAYERIFKSLADKNRLRILKLLEYKDFCVCELSFIIGITQPSVSRHLTKLKEAGFISNYRESFWTNYCLNKQGPNPVKILLGNVSAWMNDNEIIQRDKEKAIKADRNRLCKK